MCDSIRTNVFRALQKAGMTCLGRLKYFTRPPVIVFDPSTYRVKGADVREVLNLIRPGDILLRAYDGYLDSWFIRHSWVRGSTRRPRRGMFTHVALYVGPLSAAQRPQVASQISGYDWGSDRKAPAAQLPALQEAARQRFFDSVLPAPAAGEPWPDNGMVVHAMAEGVQIEDVLSFCRCDYLTILRLPSHLQLATAVDEHDFSLVPGSAEHALQQRLQAGDAVAREQAIALALNTALGKVGAEYDFDCSDLNRFQSFSCAQLVYYCYRGAADWFAMRPRWHGLFGRVMMRHTVTPDDYLEAGLQQVWRSRSLRT